MQATVGADKREKRPQSFKQWTVEEKKKIGRKIEPGSLVQMLDYK